MRKIFFALLFLKYYYRYHNFRFREYEIFVKEIIYNQSGKQHFLTKMLFFLCQTAFLGRQMKFRKGQTTFLCGQTAFLIRQMTFRGNQMIFLKRQTVFIDGKEAFL
ncbi:hypothetical protein [Chryseobacterium indoltheticum]|uniref:hypothetical protein n=1 Tax=Chryseobacterium indoltheticum TaxID=254 RepID=UPI0011C0562B|nr:hypothetical protein [Chryseobacterium indoltheticum]